MNVDLLKIWQEASGDTSLWLNQITTPGLRIGISGVIIGLGSNPLHKFVTTIEKKSKKKREKQKNERG
ncbi:hypothetical protein H8E88_35115 [candidate division KSB1 bacterium]|nr:hypothetical protein [candidate division KSB1 bacterium]